MKTAQNYVVFGWDENQDPTWVYVQAKNSTEAAEKSDAEMIIYGPAIAVSEKSIRRILADFKKKGNKP